MSDAGIVSEEELRRLCEFLYRRTGMSFNETKRYYIQRRVTERMAATNTVAFDPYFSRLRSNSDGEIEQLINAFTINETYFYREDHQLRCLTNNLLNERIGLHANRGIRIWSVPCSTGEEPYSIAIWLLEHWPHVDRYEVEIIGSDIDTRVIDAAKAGRYGARALMRLPPELVSKYFVQVDDQQWEIIEDLRQSVGFSQINLVESQQTRRHSQFDVIFCRNVLIYFDDVSRRLAAENLYECLAPGGFICLGHSESMSRISSLFEVCRYNDAIVYRRPAERA